MVLVLIFMIAPVLFLIFLGGVVLSSPSCVDVFQDATFLHRVVGFWMQLAWSLQRLVVVFLVVSPRIGTLDRIHLMVVVARALASEVVTIVAPPVPAFSVVGAMMVPVVKMTSTIISSRRLVGTSRIVSYEFICVVSVGVIFSHGEELGHRCWPFCTAACSSVLHGSVAP